MAWNLTPEQHRYRMSCIKGKNTKPERIVRSELHKRGLRFKKHVRNLPGKPDIIFVKVKVAVFLDGDFWHGYRFPQWKHKYTKFWQKKIRETIKRDKRNFAKLQRMGWRVIRIWEHSIKNDLDAVVKKIIEVVNGN